MSEQNQTVTLPDKKDIGLLTEEGLWDNWLDIDAVKKLVNHPLLIAMSEERITLSGMRYFLIQHHYYSRNFTRFLCALISHIDNFNDIHHLMENLREEDEDHAITMMHILHNITENNEQLSKRVRAVGKNTSHNNPRLKSHLIEYIEKDGITHSLDLYTNAKRAFIESFNQQILKPRGLQYRFQFTGPTGTNAVEAAMKIARKVTGRSDIVAFTNAFHGMSLGALAATAREKKRNAAGVSLNNIVRLPFENFLSQNDTSLDVLEKMLVSPGSGIDLPAAIILETIHYA
ncbi:aminotransferase class III-fold pyridoxal phosphate-dependent enzyme [Photorhabdus africana]|uniref:aminotransferase class III-fold pyridoxal phosphate-dependent enzyme n=1 Tax=Photorhabdus africana TaxID=3097554 RepID=UPI002B4121EC|nr:aminotransferase class III-fold pyridoxal phosphate-dependent enzyme [Photorhabdus sp. CRI-LC]